MNFQFISDVHPFPHQTSILKEIFGGVNHQVFTPLSVSESFDVLDIKIPVVIGTASISLAEELQEAGFDVWIPQRAYPRSVTRQWERRTVLAGYVTL